MNKPPSPIRILNQDGVPLEGHVHHHQGHDHKWKFITFIFIQKLFEFFPYSYHRSSTACEGISSNRLIGSIRTCSPPLRLRHFTITVRNFYIHL